MEAKGEIPSPDKQKEILSMKLSKSVVQGETWYLVESKWMKSLKQAIGIEKWESSAVAHPGPIDNSPLFDEVKQDIKKALVSDTDYFLVPEDGWKLLVNWYGLAKGQNPIARKAVSSGSNNSSHAIVEVYPLDLKCVKDFDFQNEIILKVSRADLLSKIEMDLRSCFNIPSEFNTRLWHVIGNEKSELKRETTAHNNGLDGVNQFVVIETQNRDGSWPQKFSENNSKTRTLSNYSESSRSGLSCPGTRSMSVKTTRHSSVNSGSQNPKQPGLCGLINLGNTCFMNSVLQCMSNCPPITEYFLAGTHLGEINETNPLGMKGEIAKAYGDLIKNMWSGRDACIIPQRFKIQVGTFNPSFCGCQQHDSQELLTFLLDGLHEDLNRIVLKPYIVVKDDSEREDAVIAQETWDNYRKRNDSIIVDTFHGLLKSRVICPQCERLSVTFDPFCYLSLPLPLKKDRCIMVRYIPYEGTEIETTYRVTIPKKGLIKDLCAELHQLTSGNPDHMLVAEITNCHFHKFFCNDDTLDTIEEKDTIYVFQLSVVPNPVDSEHMVFPVCFWKVLLPDDDFSQKDIFGIPFLIVLPRKPISTHDLHTEILHKMKRHFLIPNKLSNIPNGDYFSLDLVKDNECNYQDSLFMLYYIDTSVYSNPQRLLPEGNYYDLPALFHGQQFEKYFGRHALLLQFTIDQKREMYHEKAPTVRYNICTNLNKERNKVSIQDCLHLFTTCEKLSADDAWFCPKCRNHQRATKKFDLWKLPKILIIHLKRFQYTRYRRDKIDTLVEFPITDLNMSEYVISSDDLEMLYDLVGVCNHYGNMGGGHYTAYCKNKDTRKWYCFDDNLVTSLPEDKIMSSAAYVLFYMAKDCYENFSDADYMDVN